MDRNDAKRVIKDLKEKPYILAKDYIETASGFIITVNNTTEQKKQTNADRIHAMSDEELAKFIDKLSPCSCCRFDKNECKKSVHCCDGIAEWLKSEVKE